LSRRALAALLVQSTLHRLEQEAIKKGLVFPGIDLTP
jgi:hypothetical protein